MYRYTFKPGKVQKGLARELVQYSLSRFVLEQMDFYPKEKDEN